MEHEISQDRPSCDRVKAARIVQKLLNGALDLPDRPWHGITAALICDAFVASLEAACELRRTRLVISWTCWRHGRRQKYKEMTVHSEAEAVRQAKEYLDIGFVVHAITDGSIAHDQDQLSALYHGFDDLALKLAEKRTPRNRGEATEPTPPLDTPATELARGGCLKGDERSKVR